MTRTTRTPWALGAVLTLVTAAACAAGTSPSGAQQVTTTETTAAPRQEPPTTLRGALADQTPPKSALGVSFHDKLLWVADFYAGQLLAVDPDSGSIVRRLTSVDNISDEVSNVALAPDGTIFWIGWNDGALGVVRGNQATSLPRVLPGTPGLTLSADAKTLYAGGAISDAGLVYRIDTGGRSEVRESAAKVHLRSIAVAADGSVYGARFGGDHGQDGALVKVDPETGAAQDIALIDAAIAVTLSPKGDQAYVLSLAPGMKPALVAVDLADHAVRPLPTPRTPLADSLAVAPDGRIFVSSYNAAEISIVSPDGSVKTRTIGARPAS